MMTESGEELKLVGGGRLIKSESNKFENYGLEILPSLLPTWLLFGC
jgi:hypothetical protein